MRDFLDDPGGFPDRIDGETLEHRAIATVEEGR
jgi:hypothetical protein